MTDPQDFDARPADPVRPVNMTRRRLFRGAAAGTGVLLSVQAKTALGAGVCQSPSAMLSGNTSPRPGDGTTCSGGRSPGYWRQPQHFQNWFGATPATFKPGVEPSPCLTGLGQLTFADILNQGTSFADLFTVGEPRFKNGFTFDGKVGLWAVLAFPNDFVDGILMFHLAAAYLNAGYFTSDGAKYPMSQLQVKDMGNQILTNQTYCPTSLLQSSCPGGGLTRDELVAYLEGMYDDNAPVENMCKGNNKK